ncbi:rhodanese-like domain-containing protein [Rhodococcus sp. 2H158]
MPERQQAVSRSSLPRAGQKTSAIPEKQQTRLGLYVTAPQAYELQMTQPRHTSIIDVRTPEEYLFVGHVETARNLPLVFLTYQWDTQRNEPLTEPNPNFVPRVMSLYSRTDTLLLMCRSGERSARAVDALADAGFENVHNVLDGMEGGLVDDPHSAYHGKRMKNGWKNAGLPWTYDLDAHLTWSTDRPGELQGEAPRV